jgi:putative transposase
MDKYLGKYRRESLRLQKWDYRWAAAYFITLNTKNRVRYFGEIENGKLNPSPLAPIAERCWYDIPKHSHDIELGEFIVMPDHIHGIIIIKRSPAALAAEVSLAAASASEPVAARHALQQREESALNRLALERLETPLLGHNRFQNIGKNSLSAIVGSFKSAVSKYAGRSGEPFAWQSLFYEHIIRDKQAFLRISEYIRRNPEKWKK